MFEETLVVIKRNTTTTRFPQIYEKPSTENSFNPYPGNGGEYPQYGFCWKSHSKQWNETAIFCDIVTDSSGFPMQLSVSLYDYIYFRFYMAGLILTSTWLVLRLPALYVHEDKTNFTDVILLEC